MLADQRVHILRERERKRAVEWDDRVAASDLSDMFCTWLTIMMQERKPEAIDRTSPYSNYSLAKQNNQIKQQSLPVTSRLLGRSAAGQLKLQAHPRRSKHQQTAYIRQKTLPLLLTSRSSPTCTSSNWVKGPWKGRTSPAHAKDKLW